MRDFLKETPSINVQNRPKVATIPLYSNYFFDVRQEILSCLVPCFKFIYFKSLFYLF